MCGATTFWQPSPLVVELARDAAGRGIYEYISRRPGLAATRKPDVPPPNFVTDPKHPFFERQGVHALCPEGGSLLRYSYGSLIARKAFTVSVPSQGQVKEADYFGLVSGRDTDKFAATGWTPTHSNLVDAPYVQECPLVMECKVLQIYDLGLHTQFVGQILDVKADEAVLDNAGMPDILKILPIIFSPGNRVYYGVGESLGHAFAVGKEI